MSPCLFVTLLWIPYSFMHISRILNWKVKKSKKMDTALWRNDTSLYKKVLHSCYLRRNMCLCSKAVPIFGFHSSITHTPFWDLDLESFCLKVMGKRCREFPWGLNNVSHESNYSRLWDIMPMPSPKSQMVGVPLCSTINLSGGCDMWGLPKDVAQGKAPIVKE